MQINSRHSQIVLLIGVVDGNNILRFPSNNPTTELGLGLSKKPLIEVLPQLIDLANDNLRDFHKSGLLTYDKDDQQHTRIEIYQDFQDDMVINDETVSLFLGRCTSAKCHDAKIGPTISELIQKYRHTKTQVALMRAMQVFAGGYAQISKAVDAKDVIKELN
jgi:hypothetical protein